MEYTKEKFMQEVIGAEPDKYIKILEYKLNIILQGAPGVGKTYTARRLAWLMQGNSNNNRILQVQFHSSYTYEDFIKGLKPNETGGFYMSNGPFYNICLKANNDKEHKYFVIIDEINRGNISSILGESFTLIEKEHRGEKVNLKYGSDILIVPSNLYIIGTMNTADRGLANLDYALRRRFAFCNLIPAFESREFMQLMQKSYNSNLIKVIRKIRALNEEISKDSVLGSGFQIGHSYFCGSDSIITNEKLNNILEYEIIPLLYEYWYDDIDKKADTWAEKLRSALDE